MKISREVKIGVTGIIALVLLFFTIKFLQGVSLFHAHDTYYINFRNAKALAKSSPVYADGYNVGIVSDIRYDYEHPGRGVIIKIDVEHGMRIPMGTQAVLDEAMLGGCTLNLMMGTLNTLASDPNLKKILANAETVTANLDKSSRDLNRLLEQDVPQMAQTFTKAGEGVTQLTDKLNGLDLQGTMARVDGTMDNLNQMSDRLNSPDNTVGLLLNDTSLYTNLNQTVNGASALVEDLKAHPKRYVHFSVFGKKDK